MTQVLSLSKVAEVLGVHPNTLYRHGRGGSEFEIAPGLRAFRIGRHWKVSQVELDAFLAGAR